MGSLVQVPEESNENYDYISENGKELEESGLYKPRHKVSIVNVFEIIYINISGDYVKIIVIH